jgi:hypothetical protein
VECNWPSAKGIIIGAEWIAAERNTSAAMMRVAAIDLALLVTADARRVHSA